MNTSIKALLWVIVAAFIVGGVFLWRSESVETLGVGGAEPGADMQFAGSDLVQVDGMITEIFASADTVVVETETGEEWSITLDDYTQIYSESGTLVEVDDFTLLLEPGMRISVILDEEGNRVGDALVMRLMPEEDDEIQEVIMIRVWVV